MSKFNLPASIRNLRGRDYHLLPPVRIGDLVLFHEKDHSYTALITFEVPDHSKTVSSSPR